MRGKSALCGGVNPGKTAIHSYKKGNFQTMHSNDRFQQSIQLQGVVNPIIAAMEADGMQIQDITARAGVFSQEEVTCVGEVWEEYQNLGAEGCGYNFIVYREGEQVLGFACYGPRDLTDGVFDLFWIAVDPNARRSGVGRSLLTASEEAVRRSGGRMLIAETSGTPHYESTRKFYLDMGYNAEAVIKDFYTEGDDLAIFVKRL
ncbi:MAG: GNAT family N-acetyltransferase [Chloroflexi bacterium]|nr:GNAT family N-acetyltransferase [Chloroflexota bacterium]